MKKTLSIFYFLFICCSIFATNEIDSLLQVLDRTIEKTPYFIAQKEKRISQLKQSLQYAKHLKEKYEINNKLFDEYKRYMGDSALYYIEQNRIIAQKLQKNELLTEAKLHQIFMMSATGLYKEAADSLNSINITDLPVTQRIDYYNRQIQLCSGLEEYSSGNANSSYYRSKIQLYLEAIETLLAQKKVIIPEEKKEYLHWKFLKTDNFKPIDFQEKLISADTTTNDYSMTAHAIAKYYLNEHNLKNYQKYLILSAIGDIRTVTKENKALLDLTFLLYHQKEINRAHRYIHYTLEDANIYNARLRNMQIARIQPMINKAYEIKSKEEKEWLYASLSVISILCLILAISALYIHKQVRMLSAARSDLKEMNDKLNKLNQSLKDTNKIKEIYIGHFLNLCSTYIDKLENYRKLVNRKISSGQIEDLQKQTSSSGFISSELKEFYANFDRAFLNLFPQFVSQFNALLHEEARFVLKRGELLNTELRIFALIRLGINDSSKIADFLRYSPQTIYNYRTKVKNKAIVKRDDFEEKVKNIGLTNNE